LNYYFGKLCAALFGGIEKKKIIRNFRKQNKTETTTYFKSDKTQLEKIARHCVRVPIERKKKPLEKIVKKW
jgi:hypothetical protein